MINVNTEMLESFLLRFLKQKRKSLSPIGLFHGDMGICLALYIANSIQPSSEKLKVADELLDKVVNNAQHVADVSFERGLSGIGFAINFLHKRKCIDGDIDEILYQIDASIYRILNKPGIIHNPHLNSLLGYFIYIVDRLNNPSHSEHTFLHELDADMMRTASSKLFMSIPKELKKMNEDIYPTLLWDFPIFYYYLGEALKLNLINAQISSFIQSLEIYICSIIPYYNLNKLLIANSLAHLNEQLQNENVENYIDLLYKSVNFMRVKEEIDNNLDTFYGGWCNALINLTLTNKYIKDAQIKQSINAQKRYILEYAKQRIEILCSSTEKNPEINFVDGISGLIFALSVMPEAFAMD